VSKALRVAIGSFCAAGLLLAAVGGGAFAQTPTKRVPPARADVETIPAPKVDPAKLRDAPGLPDIVVASFELERDGDQLTYRVTFRNDGDGPIRCFNYLVSDSRSGLEVREVCDGEQPDWRLAPGATVTVEGTVSRGGLWVWPDERGYMSMLRLRANHGTEQPEKDITNNHTKFKVIYWDQNMIQDRQ
jgi:hypothetical protein